MNNKPRLLALLVAASLIAASGCGLADKEKKAAAAAEQSRLETPRNGFDQAQILSA